MVIFHQTVIQTTLLSSRDQNGRRLWRSRDRITSCITWIAVFRPGIFNNPLVVPLQPGMPLRIGGRARYTLGLCLNGSGNLNQRIVINANPYKNVIYHHRVGIDHAQSTVTETRLYAYPVCFKEARKL